VRRMLFSRDTVFGCLSSHAHLLQVLSRLPGRVRKAPRDGALGRHRGRKRCVLLLHSTEFS
jgi:hypothetical protein